MTTYSDNKNIISLFSGAGGLDLGFEKADFDIIWANENKRSVTPSYIKNFSKTHLDQRSIKDISIEDIPREVIGVIGGPPCQSWSLAGASRGIKDLKGKLFFEYIRIINQIKPLFFVAENVKGLICKKNIETFNNIIKQLEDCGYNVSWKLLNAADYGVPQDRFRVIVVGYHKSLNKSFQFPSPLEKKITLKDSIGDLAHIPVGSTSIKSHELFDDGYSSRFIQRNHVRSWNEQSFTIVASHRHIPYHPQAPKMIKSKDKSIFEFVKGSEHLYRRLTIRECARIQTFPDTYEFIYLNKKHAYEMIGNAVPVELAYQLGKVIKSDLSSGFNLSSHTCK
jgi:DNA (cytosine-5)-methyltransferase 1